MPIVPRALGRRGNEIRFGSRINDKALRDFIPLLNEALSRGFDEIVLDFRRSQRAYADAVLPLVCVLDRRREHGENFRILLPESALLRQLFLNANWAHLIDPRQPTLGIEHPQHLPARRYRSHAEQQAAVESVLEVVLRNVDLRREAIVGLEWTVNEITDNVLNHARSSSGGLVQVSTFRDEQKIKFVVADAGRGIAEAMRDAFPNLHDDVTAISEAVKRGVTSIPDSGQGNGLAGSVRIAACADGSFKVASGKAQLSVFRDDRGDYRTHTGRVGRGFDLPGTAVTMEISTQASFDIAEALGLRGPAAELSDVVDVRYGGADGELVVRVRDEALGVGTRHAGVELRRKCQNLLNAEPDKRLVLDWAGVPLISSSFADEAVGKLFVELGPTTFTGRVSHVGTETLVRSLLDSAIMQRVAQTMRVQTPRS